jgi:hypothetical protein
MHAMTFPTVIELPQRLEPLTRDTFVMPASSVRAPSPTGPGVRRIVD